MDEYISKTKFEELMRKKARSNFDLYYVDKSKHYHEKAIGYNTAADEVYNFPTADVQPVVLCKDCKYRKERHYEENGEKPYIKYECKFTKYSMSDEGFCSFGIKKDGVKPPHF